MHYIEPASFKFILLHSTDQQSKWYKYLVEELRERGYPYFETCLITEALAMYKDDEENSFIYLDLINSFSSFDLQALRGTKLYGVNTCKFELQKTKEKIIGQRIKEFSITGSNLMKFFSLCGILSDFDPFASLSCNSLGHLTGRLINSDAFCHFELVEATSMFKNNGYRYCITTDTENHCFIVMSDSPFQKLIKDEINLFLSDQLNLRSNNIALKFFEQYLYMKIISEIGELCLSQRCSFDLKPPLFAINHRIQASLYHKENERGQLVEFCTTGSAAINKEALLDPLQKFSNTTLVSFYSSNEERAQCFYSQILHFYPGYYSSLNDLAQTFKGIAYVPSLPGNRKQSEILSFITANPFNLVLAEKPAFPNHQSAQKFQELEELAQNSQGEEGSRTFFGWHYIHHPAIQEIVQRIQGRIEFGEISKITASFTRPKPFLLSERIFEPKQGGCGLDHFSYPLHLALVLSKQENKDQTFEVLDTSYLTCNQIYGKDEPQLQEVEGRLEAKLILNGSIEVDLMGSIEAQEQFFSSAQITFTSGTIIKIQWFANPHIPYKDFGLYCASIKKPTSKMFSPLPIESKFENSKTSHDFQIEKLTRIQQKLATYDTQKDMLNICTHGNLYLHQVLDAIFQKSGLSIKEGL